MPQQLITGTDCCPCNCPDTVTINQNVGSTQFMTGEADDPRGLVTPSDTQSPAIYIADFIGATTWRWSITMQQWIGF